MLRGNIDRISTEEISGWVYSDRAPVAGEVVLAFENTRCIGAGKVEVLREDLRDAGLGDGMLGFRIALASGALSEPEAVHVRLDCSDFALLPGDYLPRIQKEKQLRQDLFSKEELARLDWMNRQGWLSQEQYIALKSLNGTGVYVRTFSRAELQAQPIEPRALDTVANTLSYLLRVDVSPSRLQAEWLDSVQALEAITQQAEVIGLLGACKVTVAPLQGRPSAAAAVTPSAVSASHLTEVFPLGEHQVLLARADLIRSVVPQGSEPVKVLRLLEAASH